MSGYVDDDRNPDYNEKDWKAVLEYDKPNTNLYEDGGIRVITSRHRVTEVIGACHSASLEDLRLLEHVHGVKFTPDEWAVAYKRAS